MFEQSNYIQFLDICFPLFSLSFLLPLCYGSVRPCSLLGDGRGYWSLPYIAWHEPNGLNICKTPTRGKQAWPRGSSTVMEPPGRKEPLRVTAWTDSPPFRNREGVLPTWYKLLTMTLTIFLNDPYYFKNASMCDFLVIIKCDFKPSCWRSQHFLFMNRNWIPVVKWRRARSFLQLCLCAVPVFWHIGCTVVACGKEKIYSNY